MTSTATELCPRLRAATLSFLMLALPLLIVVSAATGPSDAPTTGTTAPVETTASTR